MMDEDRAEIEATVRETLSVVLGRPVGPADDVSREDEPDWDSLRHIELVFALESALGVRFAAEEVGELVDVYSIVDSVERHRAA